MSPSGKLRSAATTWRRIHHDSHTNAAEVFKPCPAKHTCKKNAQSAALQTYANRGLSSTNFALRAQQRCRNTAPRCGAARRDKKTRSGRAALGFGVALKRYEAAAGTAEHRRIVKFER
jgi:uncharacterized protein (DUF169 family)